MDHNEDSAVHRVQRKNINNFGKDKQMKTNKMIALLFLAVGVMVLPIGLAIAAPMGSAFTYQGRLILDGSAVTGEYDLQFKLYNSLSGGTQVGSTLDAPEVDVNEGYFTVLLDFGSAAFAGDARWLQIGVREGPLEDPNTYDVFTPRQELTPAPYALYAASAPTGGGADSDWQISGTNMFSIPVGNVGIGTTTPARKLDVAGEGSFDGTLFARDATGIGLRDDAGNFGLWVRDGGNVGVGTSTPAVQLDIEGTKNLSSSSDGIVNIGRTSSYHVSLDNNEIHGRVGNSTGTLYINDYGGNVIIGAQSTGRLGVGTSSPIERLDVAGAANLNKGIAMGIALKVNGTEALWYNGTYFSWGFGGSANYFADNVGIGTTSPADTLDVNGDIRVRGADIKDAGGTSRITLYDNGNLYLREDGGSVRMTVDTAGDVGIGTTTPDAPLEVEDSSWTSIVKIGMSTTSNRLMLGSGASWIALGGGSGAQRNDIAINHSNGYVGLSDTSPDYRLQLPNSASTSGRGRANAWVTYSSVRWKKNIQPIEDALDKVQSLRGVRFDWKEDGKADIGMVAEEVGEILPELVDYEDNGVDAKALDYGRLVALLIEAMKEQQAKIAELEDALAKTQSLEQRLQSLENTIQEQQLTVVKEVQK